MTVILKCDSCEEITNRLTTTGLRRIPERPFVPQQQIQELVRLGKDLDLCDHCLSKARMTIIGDKEKK